MSSSEIDSKIDMRHHCRKNILSRQTSRLWLDEYSKISLLVKREVTDRLLLFDPGARNRKTTHHAIEISIRTTYLVFGSQWTFLMFLPNANVDAGTD